MLWFFIILALLLAGTYLFLQSRWGQNIIAREVTDRLSRKLHTKVSVQHVDFSLFNRMHLHGLLVLDRQNDTLLFAGDARVRITDWFFLKKNADLKYIGLDDTYIKTGRTDSTWNYQFLLDYFSSGRQSDDSSGIHFNIRQIEVNRLVMMQQDRWKGQDLSVGLHSLKLDAQNFNLNTRSAYITSIDIDAPSLWINNYDGREPPMPDQNNKADSSYEWNRNGWDIQVGQINLHNGAFRNDKQVSEPLLSYFDGHHIVFSDIQGKITGVRFLHDTITGHVQISTQERSGLAVKNCTLDAKFTPHEMAFNNLDIITNRSRIRHFFKMSYEDFSQMDDFIHSVIMQGDFDNTEIDSDDLAFFAPSLKSWKKKFILKGSARGTVDDLHGKGLFVKANDHTMLNGDISLIGLPQIDKTFMDIKASEFKTTYNDLATVFSGIRTVTTPALSRIDYLDFSGNFTGFTRDFVMFGTLHTNLGTLRSDLNMKLPAGREPVYSGKLSTDDFALGEILQDNKIGHAAFNLSVKGSGFSEENRNTLMNGSFSFLDWQGYRYKNINVNGQLDKDLFKGQASMNDDNAVLQLNGTIDYNGGMPAFNLKADISKANLRPLNLSQDNITFSGKLQADFTGNNIDNFSGKATVYSATVRHNHQELPFDSLTMITTTENGIKKMDLRSNAFNASITGNFSLKDLPASFAYLLNKYYPSYVKAPLRMPVDQDIHFDIITQNADSIFRLVDSSLAGFDNSHISGSINTQNNQLHVEAEIPQFSFRQFVFDDVRLVANGNADSLSVKGRSGNIKINDSLHIPMADLSIRAQHDSSEINILTGANEGIEKASISALVETFGDGVKITFKPSLFTINGKVWTIDKNGQLEFRKNSPAVGHLLLTEQDQSIALNTLPSGSGDWNDLKITLQKINLGDIAPYFVPHNRLEGLASGDIIVENPTGNLKIHSDNLQTKYLRLDNDSLGEVNAKLDYDDQTRELKFSGGTANQQNYLGFDGHLFINAPKLVAKNNIALTARSFQLKVLERFLGTLFSDISGYLTGDITLAGNMQSPAVTGKGRISSAGLKVNFTQCYYKINDTDVQITPQLINLDGLVLKDTATGNPLYVSGGITHESFRNMFYNVSVSTQRPNTTGQQFNKPVLLLNTTSKNNKQFYGKAFGTGSFSLIGPQSDMFMDINALASDRDSSSIVIPNSNSRVTGDADFLVERKYGHEMIDSGAGSGEMNIVYNVKVTATPRVTATVLLDELTGDKITGRGTGTLDIVSGTAEPLSIRGRFDIDEGNYLYTFQSFLKKPFELRKGAGNYIEWNGDPYDANINVTAVYTASNVSFYPLSSGSRNIDPKVANSRGDVYVVARLTDKLFNPQIAFSLDFPPASLAVTDPSLSFALQQLQKNPNEMNTQATFLVVFGVFSPSADNLAAGNNSTFQDIAANSISAIFFNEISNKIKDAVSNIFKTQKLNFNFSSSIYNRNVLDATGKLNLGSNINASLGRSLFKDRLIVSISGSVEGLLQSGSIQQNVQLLPNLNIEILLNQSGTFRANLFYRQSLDYLTGSASGPGRQNRAGMGVSYKKEADRFWDLFRKKNKVSR